MTKIFKIYDRLAEWLCDFTSDKYVHLLAGLLITFFVSWLAALTTHGVANVECARCGFIIGVLVGITKEIIDAYREKPMDCADLLFTVFGCVLGSVLYTI